MGTKMAPSYAIIFMAQLEEQFISQQPKNLRFGGDLLTTYASTKDLTELRKRLFSSVLHDTSSVEIVVYEYACVAESINRSGR